MRPAGGRGGSGRILNSCMPSMLHLFSIYAPSVFHLYLSVPQVGGGTPLVEDLTTKLQQVEGRLEESESYCYQVLLLRHNTAL